MADNTARLAEIEKELAELDGFIATETRKETITDLESFGRGIGQGASFGLSDELVGAIQAKSAHGTGRFDIGSHVREARSPGFLKKREAEAREEEQKFTAQQRDDNKIAREANPAAYVVGDVLGSIGAMAAPAAPFAAATTGLKGLTQMIAKGSLFAAEGAAQGFGRGDTPEERAENAKVGAVLGLGTGVGGQAVASTIRNSGSRFWQAAAQGKFGNSLQGKAIDKANSLAIKRLKGTDPEIAALMAKQEAQKLKNEALKAAGKDPNVKEAIKQFSQFRSADVLTTLGTAATTVPQAVASAIPRTIGQGAVAIGTSGVVPALKAARSVAASGGATVAEGLKAGLSGNPGLGSSLFGAAGPAVGGL